MPKRSSKKRPADINKLAASIVAHATSECVEDDGGHEQDDGKNPAAVALGRLGGKVGGKARAQRLTAKRRSEIARKAARARWSRST